MTTKINGLDVRPAAPAAPAPIARSKDSLASDGAPVGREGRGVRITDTARQLASLEKLVGDAPEVDRAKVAEISLALERGTYEIHPDKIADRLLRLEHELARAAGRLK